MKKTMIKLVVIASMKIALWRMKLRFFLHTKRCDRKNVFRKIVQKLTKITDNQNKNTVKLVKMDVDEI
jgi:uncharacterized protein YxeA